MINKKPTIILFRESLLQSVLADMFTFAIILGGTIVKHIWYADSIFFNIVWLLVFGVYLVSKFGSKKHEFTSFDDAIAHLVKEKNKSQL